MKALKVSDEIESYCGKCKMTLAHSIVALVDGAPAKVRCLTCFSDHKPRKEPGTAATKTKKKKSTTSTKSSPWQEQMRMWSVEKATPYTISKTYSVDEFINHKKFGKGIVTRIPSPEKIIALFESGEKMLLQGHVKR